MRITRRSAIGFSAGAVVAAAGLGGLAAWNALKPGVAPGPTPVAQADLPKGFKTFDPPLPMGGLAFLDADGKTVKIADFKGRPVVLNIWAKWCAPCLAELPQLDELQSRGGVLAVLAVAVDEPDPSKVKGFLINRGLTHLEPYLDPKNVFAKALDIKSIPVSVLINRQGFAMVRADAPVAWFSTEAVALIQQTLLQGGG
jgi:thiol-disulfide isomerase/thioredoxin